VPRIRPLNIDEASAESRAEWDKQVREHGRMTNMKRTLAHSWPALRALMEWYQLRDEVALFLGDRLTDIFAHVISDQADCLVCSTFFRRILIERGENPDQFQLDDWEQRIVDFGRQLARDPHLVTDDLYSKLASRLTEQQIVSLTAFGCLMLATNVFNDALQVDLDEYLQPYAKRAQRTAGA
jgi:alkylhydroperoxidase family enzyme